MKDQLLEQLAALEHEQWAHWTSYMLDNDTVENVLRWRKQIETPYADLSEKEKESDREWARKVLAVLERLDTRLLLDQIIAEHIDAWKALAGK